MFKRTKSLLFILGLAALLEAGAFVVTAVAQKVDNNMPKQERTLAPGENPGENEVKQLLVLMDTDKNGKISKQEYLNLMAAEFDRLDRDKGGERDIRELAQSQIRARRPNAGK